MPANGQHRELNGHCIAGIIDAEAHFGIAEMNGGGSFSCYMNLAVRDDDIELLHGMAAATDLGVVRRKDDRGNPQAYWSVYRMDDAFALASYLTRYPLRSRKRNDFEVWNAPSSYGRAALAIARARLLNRPRIAAYSGCTSRIARGSRSCVGGRPSSPAC